MSIRMYCLSVLLFISPAILHAGTINYAHVTEHTEEVAIVRQSSLTHDAWFSCLFRDQSCATVASSTTLTVSSTPQLSPTFSEIRPLLPLGATNLTRSPDNQYIAFYIPGTHTRNQRTFGVIYLPTSTISLKTEPVHYWDLLTEGIRIFSFSPDGKTLLYISDEKGYPTLYRVDLTTPPQAGVLKSTKMFTRDYTVADVIWKDDNTLLFIANRDNPYNYALYQYSLHTHELKKLRDNASYATRLTRIGNLILFSEITDSGVRPVFYHTETGLFKNFNLPDTGAKKIQGKVVTTLKEGLSGVFFLEENKNSDTLIVWLHGGPYRQASLYYHPYKSYGGYDFVLEKARSAQVGILKLDYPGSAGFGRVFAESLTGNVGKEDVRKSSVAIADFAKRNGYKNVYLMGNSYGGYLALRLLVENPSLYKGAFSINGVTDWTTMLTALDSSIFNVHFGGTVGDENDNYNLYAQASVYNRAEKITNQKIILMHGTSDRTIPSRQSEGFATFLTSIGKAVTYIPLQGEDHVFSKPESFTLLCETTLLFVGKSKTGHCAL